MTKNTAQVNINILNQAYSVSDPVSGVVFVIGKTLRGPDNDPKTVITSVPQFVRIFGAEDPNNDFPELCMQAIRAGAALRVCRVVGDAADSSITANIATSGAVALFKIQSKERGAYNNNLRAIVANASNGSANYFNLTVEDTVTGVTESFENLIVTGFDTAGPYNYLKKITDLSSLVSPVYLDISAIETQPRPANGTFNLTGGVDAAPVLADYVGVSAAKTGLYAFNDYDDAYILAAPSINETVLAGFPAAASGYVTTRGDLIYLYHLDNGSTTTTTIGSEISGLGLSSKFFGIIGGGAKFVNTFSGGLKSMEALGELLGVITTSFRKNGVWASPTNRVNGKLPTAAGVVNNFGSPASIADLNLLANTGANMVILRYGDIMLWDFYSMANGESPEKFLTTVLTQIYLKKALKPFLEGFLNRPNTPETWLNIYYGVKPFLDNLLGKAFNTYAWEGDQFATGLGNLSINDPVLVGQGKYKAQLRVTMVVPMVEFTLDFVMENNSVQIV
jgi:hypothetical protein